jgi:hypothetical protein
MTDLKPHFDSVSRSARLLGMVRGLRYAQAIMRKHGIDTGTPIDKAIVDLIVRADEDMAATSPEVGPVRFSEPAA